MASLHSPSTRVLRSYCRKEQRSCAFATSYYTTTSSSPPRINQGVFRRPNRLVGIPFCQYLPSSQPVLLGSNLVNETTVRDGSLRMWASSTQQHRAMSIITNNINTHNVATEDTIQHFAFPPPPIPTLPVVMETPPPPSSSSISSTNEIDSPIVVRPPAALLFPIHRVYCVGKNYADHVREMGGDVHKSTPVFFTKPIDGVILANSNYCAINSNSNITTTAQYHEQQQLHGRIQNDVHNSNSATTSHSMEDSNKTTSLEDTVHIMSDDHKERIVVTKGSTPIQYPPNTTDLHYEVELVVAIGKGGRDISPHDAMDYVYGYAVGIDLTRRDLQAIAKKTGTPWDAAKYFDQSAPMGPITQRKHHHRRGDQNDGRKDIVPVQEDATISLYVNGEMKQSAKLDEMIWSIPEIISQLSMSFYLREGDLIMTGTPSGVGPVVVGDRIVGMVDGLESVDITIV